MVWETIWVPNGTMSCNYVSSLEGPKVSLTCTPPEPGILFWFSHCIVLLDADNRPGVHTIRSYNWNIVVGSHPLAPLSIYIYSTTIKRIKIRFSGPQPPRFYFGAPVGGCAWPMGLVVLIMTFLWQCCTTRGSSLCTLKCCGADMFWIDSAFICTARVAQAWLLLWPTVYWTQPVSCFQNPESAAWCYFMLFGNCQTPLPFPSAPFDVLLGD